MAFSPLRLAILCAGLALALLTTAPVSAQELLQNGGFEQGTTGWSGPGITTAGCTPRTGGSALAVATFVQQSPASPIGSSAYELDGWLRAKQVSATAELTLIWLDKTGAELTTAKKTIAAGADYAPFNLKATAPDGSRGMRLRIGGAVCLDDLSLSGPPPSTLATATPSALPSNTSVNAPAQPGASATVRPAATAQPTSVAAQPDVPAGHDFLNGGFEGGLTGWSKFGGSLSIVDSPVQSGRHAAQLSSNTDSTKWAYQTVLVEPSQSYEFTGYVGSDAGVASAYLRVSWYASTDGSGVAISNTDSTTGIADSSGLTYLSTGPVGPPPGARSARVRVVMTPLSAAPASIVFDELWFGTVAAVAPSPAPEAAERSTAPSAAASVAGTTRRNSAPASDAETPERTTEVRSAASPTAPDEARPTGPLPVTRDKDRGVPLSWLAGAGLFLVALFGSFFQGRRGSG